MVLKETYKRGYLVKITNSKGTKAPVIVAEGVSGFHARYAKTNRLINVKGRGAESLARRLAKSGHKTVTIFD